MTRGCPIAAGVWKRLCMKNFCKLPANSESENKLLVWLVIRMKNESPRSVTNATRHCLSRCNGDNARKLLRGGGDAHAAQIDLLAAEQSVAKENQY